MFNAFLDSELHASGGRSFFTVSEISVRNWFSREKNSRRASTLPENQKIFPKFGASRSKSFESLQKPLGVGSPRLPGVSHAEWERIGFLDIQIFHFGYRFNFLDILLDIRYIFWKSSADSRETSFESFQQFFVRNGSRHEPGRGTVAYFQEALMEFHGFCAKKKGHGRNRTP